MIFSHAMHKLEKGRVCSPAHVFAKKCQNFKVLLMKKYSAVAVSYFRMIFTEQSKETSLKRIRHSSHFPLRTVIGSMLG
jgi:hypothetical protein